MKNLLFLLFLISWGSYGEKQIELQGAGATFPYPLYSKMFDVYHKEFNVRINYQPIGSGGGERQLVNKTIDFGASDAFIPSVEMKEEVLYIPICLGGVVITYNLPNAPKIKLTGDIIADIFLGKIKRWNDKRIRSINPSLKLPNKKIIVIRRSDASGTTFMFSDYLCKVSKEWEKNIGRGTALNWMKETIGGKGNAGVVALVKQIPYSISYVELTYALEQGLPCALIKNKKGNFIEPSVSSISMAGETRLDTLNVSLTDTEAELGYPISGFTYILVYKKQADREKGEALAKLLWWMSHEGQQYTKPLHYAPLSKGVIEKVEKIIRSITYNNEPLFK